MDPAYCLFGSAILPSMDKRLESSANPNTHPVILLLPGRPRLNLYERIRYQRSCWSNIIKIPTQPVTTSIPDRACNSG